MRALGFRALVVIYYPDQQNILISHNGEELRLDLPVPGRHNALNTLAAVAVCKALNIKNEVIKKGLQNFIAPFGRSQVRQMDNGGLLICDYYNASPESVAAGIATLCDIAKDRARVARAWRHVGARSG